MIRLAQTKYSIKRVFATERFFRRVHINVDSYKFVFDMPRDHDYHFVFK